MSTDPRRPGGSIAGPGGPHDVAGVVIDTTNVALVGRPGDPKPILAIHLSGRINKTQDRAEILYLTDGDGAAALVSELIALAHRVGPEFYEALMERIRKLLEDGAT